MKRRLGLVLLILGLAAALLGILSATVWRASNVVTMAAPRPSAPVAVTDPGVLDLMEGEVTIEAQADDDQPITLVFGRPSQVDAWVAGSPHQRLTGAAGWDALEATEVPLADGGTETVPSPLDADGWQRAEQGETSLTTTWEPGDGETSLLAVTDGSAAAPALTLSWQREVTTPWLWPGIIGGGLLALLGAVLLALGLKEGREKRAARTVAADRDAPTTTLPIVPPTGKSSAKTPGSKSAGSTVAGSTSTTTTTTATPTADGSSAAPSRRARREKEGR